MSEEIKLLNLRSRIISDKSSTRREKKLLCKSDRKKLRSRYRRNVTNPFFEGIALPSIPETTPPPLPRTGAACREE